MASLATHEVSQFGQFPCPGPPESPHTFCKPGQVPTSMPQQFQHTTRHSDGAPEFLALRSKWGAEKDVPEALVVPPQPWAPGRGQGRCRLGVVPTEDREMPVPARNAGPSQYSFLIRDRQEALRLFIFFNSFSSTKP